MSRLLLAAVLVLVGLGGLWWWALAMPVAREVDPHMADWAACEAGGASACRRVAQRLEDDADERQRHADAAAHPEEARAYRQSAEMIRHRATRYRQRADKLEPTPQMAP